MRGIVTGAKGKPWSLFHKGIRGAHLRNFISSDVFKVLKTFSFMIFKQCRADILTSLGYHEHVVCLLTWIVLVFLSVIRKVFSTGAFCMIA